MGAVHYGLRQEKLICKEFKERRGLWVVLNLYLRLDFSLGVWYRVVSRVTRRNIYYTEAH
jgi:hypothetical protein